MQMPTDYVISGASHTDANGCHGHQRIPLFRTIFNKYKRLTFILSLNWHKKLDVYKKKWQVRKLLSRLICGESELLEKPPDLVSKWLTEEELDPRWKGKSPAELNEQDVKSPFSPPPCCFRTWVVDVKFQHQQDLCCWCESFCTHKILVVDVNCYHQQDFVVR